MRALILIGLAAAMPAAALPVAALAQEAPATSYGADPELPAPQRGLLPDMTIPRPALWGDDLPTVPEGYAISAIATGLKIPRQTLILPNGDILVAEGKGASAPAMRPKDIIAGFIKALGKSPVSGGNRLTLLRDADGDGRPELRSVFIDKLDAPYGMALIGKPLPAFSLPCASPSAHCACRPTLAHSQGEESRFRAPARVLPYPANVTAALTASARITVL